MVAGSIAIKVSGGNYNITIQGQIQDFGRGALGFWKGGMMNYSSARSPQGVGPSLYLFVDKGARWDAVCAPTPPRSAPVIAVADLGGGASAPPPYICRIPYIFSILTDSLGAYMGGLAPPPLQKFLATPPPPSEIPGSAPELI